MSYCAGVRVVPSPDPRPPAGPINEYLSELAAAGQRPATVRLRGYQLRSWVSFAGDPLAAGRGQVVAWLASDMAPSTRASRRAALEGFYRWVQAAGVGVGNPVAGLPRVRVPASTKRDCPDTVVSAVLEDAGPRIRAAVVLARWAGLRAGEVAAVHADDLSGSSVLYVRGKGGKTRAVPVGPRVAAVIPPGGYVFPGRFGGHVRPGTVTAWLRAALPDPWTAHSLRHAFATEFYAACGHDLLWTADVLGHSSVETTRRYIHSTRDAGPVVAVIGAAIG